MFKAPQKSLKSSWVEIVFAKPKKSFVTKKSLGSRPTPITRYRGELDTHSNQKHSNQY